MRLKKFDLKKYLAENKLLKEGNITITHNDVTGDSKSTVIDVSLIDNLINRLQPIVGNKTIEINNKMREDFIQTIVRRLTGYTDMGGGNVRINENKPLDEEYPKEITVTPTEKDHPLKSLTLVKTKRKFKSTNPDKDKTPVYITKSPEGLDDYYYVWQIDFDNKTVEAL